MAKVKTVSKINKALSGFNKSVLELKSAVSALLQEKQELLKLNDYRDEAIKAIRAEQIVTAEEAAECQGEADRLELVISKINDLIS